MGWWFDLLQKFLLAFSALFSIVNPFGGALMFSQVTAGRTHLQRVALAQRIGVYAFLVMFCALWIGVYVLSFFGITVAALRIAGGLVVAATAWQMLSAPESREEQKAAQAGEAVGVEDVAFFPLTMPLTTGPGTIAVAIALGSNRPETRPELLSFLIGTSAAALVIALLVWITYQWADGIVALIGKSGTRVVSRLAAFLLLCVGTQITLNGVLDAVRIAREAVAG